MVLFKACDPLLALGVLDPFIPLLKKLLREFLFIFSGLRKLVVASCCGKIWLFRLLKLMKFRSLLFWRELILRRWKFFEVGYGLRFGLFWGWMLTGIEFCESGFFIGRRSFIG